MKAIHNILTVAKYESKTLLRSWFFRIFSILALVFVFFFNLGTQTSVGFPNGDMVALPSMIPFINLYIINIAQAIIAVFLASDFLKRDKKLDTTEVIYMRSMTNADYVIGKTLGNVWVFIILNALALGIVAVFNLASPYNQFRLMPYFYYFLLISVPTLIFILGFSFFLMSVIKNQAVTFLLLLGYIAATLFYLQNKFHYIFDYMAFHLPMTWSDFVGFGFLNEILVHRGIYFFLGIGFIGLTIMLLKRLPQSNIIRKATLVTSIVSLGLGFGLGYKYIQNITNQDQLREEMIALNDKYAEQLPATARSYQIELEHKGKEISATVDICLKNNQSAAMSEIILTLNPGLNVTDVNGAAFEREMQLIRLKPANPLQPGDSLQVKISYKGTINESFCYLDMTRERLEIWMNRGNGIADKKHAFVTENYLLLTPETRWYPTPGISYSTNGLNWLSTSFADYSLKVKSLNGLKAISQGKAVDEGNGNWSFKPEHPLTQISLAVGDYETRSVTVDSVEYSLNYFKGHNYFDEYFKVLPDSITPVIRDLKKTWEVKVRMEYPYQRFQLVEIPVQFCSFNHVWTSAMEQVQPETVYLPEGGFKINSANFAITKRFSERRTQESNETISPRETEENYLKRFVNDALLGSKVNQWGGGNMGIRIGGGGPNFRAEESNPYFIFPNYFTYVTCIESDNYPITNRVMEAYLSKTAIEGGNPWLRNMLGLSEDEKGNIALQDKSFSEILKVQEDPDIIDNVIQTKSGFLFTLMKGAVGPDSFDNFLYQFVGDRKFRSVPVSELNEQMRNSFNLDLDLYMPKWYDSKLLPGYIVSDIKAYNVQSEDQVKTVVSFVLTNTEEIPGAISITFRLGGGGRGGGGFRMGGPGGSDDNIEKTIAIGAKESKSVTYLLNKPPRMMTVNTYASHNIPSTIAQRFDKIELDEKAKVVENEMVIPYFDGSEPNEIIVDTEDPGFSLVQPESSSLIKKIFSAKPSDDDLKYKGMNMWNPVVDWTLTTNDQFYGKQIRSAYYCKGGTGERKAVWTIPVTTNAYYKAYAYIPKISFGWRGDDKKAGDEYNFTIVHDDGEDHQSVQIKDLETGWVELGSYHFSAETARIELSNDTKAKSVYADAVKLVKEN
jgi:ABC-type transport system involved in multi-copper enzyme maturation permease subunit